MVVVVMVQGAVVVRVQTCVLLLLLHVRAAVGLRLVTAGQVEAVLAVQQHLLLVTLMNNNIFSTDTEAAVGVAGWGYSFGGGSAHRAGVDGEGALDEVKLQDAGLRGRLEGCGLLCHLYFLLLLMCPLPRLLGGQHPQVVALCSPALQHI